MDHSLSFILKGKTLTAVTISPVEVANGNFQTFFNIRATTSDINTLTEKKSSKTSDNKILKKNIYTHSNLLKKRKVAVSPMEIMAG